MLRRSEKLLACACVILSSCCGSPSVTIRQGKLEGVDMKTQGGRSISGFLGIPYARPPIGDLRFKAPQPAVPWRGTYSATNGGIECIQFRNGKLNGEEDCLHLNLYVPQGNTTALPVMVYIFGGIFLYGSARVDIYDPNYIMDHDVVLVTVNHRLGPLGFLTTGDLVAPGNFGLKDLIMSLRWVRENVAAFGGDPDRVTLFGNSAGSAAVHFLTLSDLTKGLFHRFILQSATATNPGLYRDRYQSSLITKEFAKFFNCSTATSEVIVECLRGQDASSLVSWRSPITNAAFLVTNEPESDEAVITDHPESLIEQGKMHDLPWICGLTKDEGLLVTSKYADNESLWDELLVNFRESIEFIGELHEVDDVTRYTNSIIEYYFNDMTIDKNMVRDNEKYFLASTSDSRLPEAQCPEAPFVRSGSYSKLLVCFRYPRQQICPILQNYTKFGGDVFFIYPIVNLIQAQQRVATQPLYMYLFAYQDQHSMTYDFTGNKTVLGVCHGDEVIYLFSRYMIPDRNMSKTDMEMVRRMTGLWTSFAANGVPTLIGVDEAEEWLEYDESGRYLRIGGKTCVSLAMESGLFLDRMRFWKGLIGSYEIRKGWRCPLDFTSAIVILIISFIFIKVY